VFFEPSHQGHVALHVTRMVAHLAGLQTPYRSVFVLSEQLVTRLDAQTRRLLDATPGLSLDFLDPEAVGPCISGSAMQMGRARWKLSGQHAQRHGAEHVFFFLLDTVLIGAIIARRDDPIASYSGILFRPRLHLKPIDGARSVRERFKAFRQYPYYALALGSRRLHAMWTLDPLFPDFARRWLPEAHKVSFISEEAISDTPMAATATQRPKNARVVFLLYGVLKRRKGILNVLEACARLSSADAARIELRLMGEVVPEDRYAVRAGLEWLATASPNVIVVQADTFLLNADLIAEIAAADVVLAPYVGHVGSSGVVYNAALHGKALISCREGLIGALVDQYRLGLAVNPQNAQELHEAMTHLLDSNTRREIALSPHRQAYLTLNQTPWTQAIVSGLPFTPHSTPTLAETSRS
jgi:glycosyltransferase involved in cell wall biosynthesis